MSTEPPATPGALHPGTPHPGVPRSGAPRSDTSRPDAPRAGVRPSSAPPSAPVFFYVGASHHTAPLALRERLALTAGKLDAIHARLAALPGLREIAILNTCNRVEFYGVAATPDCGPDCDPVDCNPAAAAPGPGPAVSAAGPAVPAIAPAAGAHIAAATPAAAGAVPPADTAASITPAAGPDASAASAAPATLAAAPTAPAAAGPAAAAIGRIEAEFCALQHIPAESFRAIRRCAHGPDALRHLLEVSAGLDSQMLGETEILGQVKDAYAAAQTRRTAGPVLNRVFQKTFQHAKYIRTRTAVTEGVISTANVAVDLALKIFGRLDRARILLLGAGEIAEKTARAFHSRGAAALTVASRTFGRALALARLFNGAVLPLENVPRHLAGCDIVVCSTAAPGVVITREAVAAAMRARRARPLFFIDLALPRDVEPAVADLENVFLYDLDDLARIAAENRAARAAEVAKAKGLARQKSAQLWEQIARLAAPVRKE
ncbi:MAG: glutamyl-tRNA reductase [Opitutaceae bacterium]|jgi:glutamyl-tRNA reductase|nr:glutamyl-tRNA reductase [Opitutaceae bacterium]